MIIKEVREVKLSIRKFVIMYFFYKFSDGEL